MICNLCPRSCGAERTETKAGGVCAMPASPVCAKAQLHLWEEPCLVGEHGAGTVFFSGCNLRCSFCQNGIISQEGYGKPITAARLREIYEELIAQGAACIDLVTPTHFTPVILESLRDPLPVPVVWNSGGYEKPETLQLLDGKVQIYLPDLKYALPEPAKKYSAAEDYFLWASAAILEMFRQTGPYRMENGGLLSGVLIRHLLLPGELENTRRCIDWVAETFRPGEVLFSLMSQYTPQPGAAGNLARHVTKSEYAAAVSYMENCGITDGFTQERTSAKEEYTPSFDGSGI
ncbi:MAG: 4Fe-4S cluster-binding domain-containing protein [Oscillibacter sp.]|nr:4Fe-4S cluster-binding domain-containing protein [Oscillibacter sp.]